MHRKLTFFFLYYLQWPIEDLVTKDTLLRPIIVSNSLYTMMIFHFVFVIIVFHYCDTDISLSCKSHQNFWNSLVQGRSHLRTRGVLGPPWNISHLRIRGVLAPLKYFFKNFFLYVMFFVVFFLIINDKSHKNEKFDF